MTRNPLDLPDAHFIKHFHYGDIGINLNSRISIIGYEAATPDNYYWHGQKRGNTEFILWQYTIAGMGELVFDGNCFTLQAGQAMLLKIPHNNYYRVHSQAKLWEFIFVIMRGSECQRICEAVINMSGPVSAFYHSAQVLKTVGSIINNHHEKSPCELSALAYSLSMNLSTEILAGAGNKIVPERLKSAKKYALKNFSTGITVDDLARTANMSYSHFVRDFTKTFNITPGAYLQQLRIEKAVNLLQNSPLSIKDIAIECGYASSSYFCRAFQFKLNSPPGAYRYKKLAL